MKILKSVLAVILVILLALSPLVTPVVYALSLPSAYSDSFLGVLDEKYERLHSVEGEKIVVIGGSSVAFGIDSEALERYTGMPVVNFGLYASLGTRAMLDLSLDGIGEGDIVILSPEMDIQTMSMYFSSPTMLKAIEDNPSMMLEFDTDTLLSLLFSMWDFAIEKQKHLEVGVATDSVYSSEYFDEYLDYDYKRLENTMDEYYDTNTPIHLDKNAYGGEFFEFSDYLNKYISLAEGRGATVYYSFPPMNELAVVGDDYNSFTDFLKENIGCEFIDTLEGAILDPGYFFDTNYHLNEYGRSLRTIRLAKAIRLYHGITEGIISDKEPSPPALPTFDVTFDKADENAKYFTYEQQKNGSYKITGLSDEGRLMEELTLPLGYNGAKVTSVGEAAFKGGILKTLIIPKASNISKLENGAFVDSDLEELYIYKTSGNDIAPPRDFSGTGSGFTVYIPEGSDFTTHYYWSERGLRFEVMEN